MTDEVTKLLEVLEDAFWRLNELDLQDIGEDEDLQEKIDDLITNLGRWFA